MSCPPASIRWNILSRPAPRSHAERLLETTLDMLPFGIVLVEADARIVHANAAAAGMLRAAEPILSQGGALRPSCKIAAAPNKNAMSAGWLGVCGANIPLMYRDGRVAVAHVRALSHGFPHPRHAMRAAFAIFITAAAARAPLPLEALRTLFDLTPSEARVIEQIALGRNRRETAAALGVADSTVKSHLERIYSKTGTADQMDLRRLLAALSSPAAQPYSQAL